MKQQEKETNEWEVIIIGAGPAGSAAAMVLARMRRKVLILDNKQPRNRYTHGMHNYLSRDGISPSDFLRLAHEELANYHIAHITTQVTAAVKNENDTFSVTADDGQQYHGKKLLLAMGVTDNIPGIPGMERLWGRGVYHCPYCDGWELCDKNIGLYARNFNGYGMALSLKQLTKNITLFTDGAGYLKKDQVRILHEEGIKVVTARIERLHCSDDNQLTCVVMKNGAEIGCDAVFVHHGYQVNNELLLQLGARCTSKGAAVTNRRQACSIPGLYVAGDAAIDIHFVAVAAAEGTKAAVAIHDDLMKTANELRKSKKQVTAQ